MAAADPTSPDAADKALIDRARQPGLGALEKAALRDLIRDLRARRDAVPQDDKAARRPVVAALRRAVEERKYRDETNDAGNPRATLAPAPKSGKPIPSAEDKQLARAARQQERADKREAAKAHRKAAAGGDLDDAAKAARKARKSRPE